MDYFKQYIEKQKYLLIMNNGETNYHETYESLRELSNDIAINYSTISKKLKNENFFYHYADGTNYFIYKFNY